MIGAYILPTKTIYYKRQLLMEPETPPSIPPDNQEGITTNNSEEPKICVVCKQSEPQTKFSCCYKVHEKNVNLFKEYNGLDKLDFGFLCNRCYVQWYESNRRQKKVS